MSVFVGSVWDHGLECESEAALVDAAIERLSLSKVAAFEDWKPDEDILALKEYGCICLGGGGRCGLLTTRALWIRYWVRWQYFLRDEHQWRQVIEESRRLLAPFDPPKALLLKSDAMGDVDGGVGIDAGVESILEFGRENWEGELRDTPRPPPDVAAKAKLGSPRVWVLLENSKQ